jgi:hypothetical protein
MIVWKLKSIDLGNILLKSKINLQRENWYFIMEIRYQDPIMAKDNHCKWQIIMTFFTWFNENLAMKSHHSCLNLFKKNLLQCGKVRKVSSLLVLQGRSSHNITFKKLHKANYQATSMLHVFMIVRGKNHYQFVIIIDMLNSFSIKSNNYN